MYCGSYKCGNVNVYVWCRSFFFFFFFYKEGAIDNIKALMHLSLRKRKQEGRDICTWVDVDREDGGLHFNIYCTFDTFAFVSNK
jgi:hypothetical protein